jgi:hypothetical protein
LKVEVEVEEVFSRDCARYLAPCLPLSMNLGIIHFRAIRATVDFLFHMLE